MKIKGLDIQSISGIDIRMIPYFEGSSRVKRYCDYSTKLKTIRKRQLTSWFRNRHRRFVGEFIRESKDKEELLEELSFL